MANEDILMFTHRDLVTLLLKEKGIHEGIWMLSMTFGLSVANLPILAEGAPPPPNPADAIFPAGIVFVQGIGIRPAPSLNNLSVDAAVVNPKPKSTRARKTPKKK